MIKMNSAKRIISAVFIVFLGIGCSSRSNSRDVVYLIPHQFEGAVVVLYDQKDGSSPVFDGKSHFITVPGDGVVKVTDSYKSLSGPPKFMLVDEKGNKTNVEYLYQRKTGAESNTRTENDVSAEEAENKVFAMIYESPTFKTANGKVSLRSFLVCKIKDGNLFATRDLTKKIGEFQRTFPR